MKAGKRGNYEKPVRLDMAFGEALQRFARTDPKEVVAATQQKGRAVNPKQGEFELIHYQTPDCAADFTLDPTNETVWATQQQIAAAFGVSGKTVSEHLRNVFNEGELDETSVVRKFRITASDGKSYETLHYSLDAILSVGYRVSSKRATAFRRWATQTLKEYITQGFALDEQRLRRNVRHNGGLHQTVVA